jgi:hypothetical protein
MFQHLPELRGTAASPRLASSRIFSGSENVNLPGERGFKIRFYELNPLALP